MDDQYKEILKKKGISGKEIAEMLDMNYHSYRVATMNKRTKYPRWVRAFVLGYNIAKNF